MQSRMFKPHILTFIHAFSAPFFYIFSCYFGLRGPQFYRILKDVNDFVESARKFYNMPLEEKLEYDIDKLGMHNIDG